MIREDGRLRVISDGEGGGLGEEPSVKGEDRGLRLESSVIGEDAR